MKDLTREEFIAQTIERSERASNENIRAKYWEIAGKALGYLEPPKIENANIAVFQSVSQGMMEFLRDKAIEFQDIKIPIESSTTKESIPVDDKQRS